MNRDRLLSECPQCEGPIGLNNVTGRPKQIGQRVDVYVECHDCGKPFVLKFTAPQWAIVVDHLDNADRREAERIGRKVAEFRRVDLAIVDCVEDIAPFWVAPFRKAGAL